MGDDPQELEPRRRGATIRIDAVDDALEVLEDLRHPDAGSAGGSAPPPLPAHRRSQSGPPTAPRRNPMVYVVVATVGLAAAAAGLWAASAMLTETSSPEAGEPSMEIGPIQVSTE